MDLDIDFTEKAGGTEHLDLSDNVHLAGITSVGLMSVQLL